jgi:hypothetical protein
MHSLRLDFCILFIKKKYEYDQSYDRLNSKRECVKMSFFVFLPLFFNVTRENT